MRTVRTSTQDAWPEISAAIAAARVSDQVRPEIVLDDVPAPIRLATHALAISGEIMDGELELAHGRLVLLHEPAGQETWQGNTRFVIFIKAVLEPDLATDPLLLEVGWEWLTEALAARGVAELALSGTVSRTGSQAFGEIAEREPEGAIEVRASWTMQPADVASGLLAWCDLLATAAGLVPLSEGVSALPAKRTSR